MHKANAKKGNSAVIWLDIANAYRPMPTQAVGDNASEVPHTNKGTELVVALL